MTFTSYFSNSSQCVRIHNVLSTEETLNFGVPQGNVLGPTLLQIIYFILFIIFYSQI